jgi:hypothetical protein
VCKWLDTRDLERQATQWEERAQLDAKLSWTAEDAAQWLGQHGFRVIAKTDAHSERGQYAVYGVLQLDPGRWLGPPAWLNLKIEYDVKRKVVVNSRVGRARPMKAFPAPSGPLRED